MFMVTQKEERAIKGIEGIYCSLQDSTEKVMAALQYNNLVATQKKSFWQQLFSKKIETTNKELHELLEALTVLKSIFEADRKSVV